MRMGTKWAWMSVSKPSVCDALGLRAAEQLTLNQWVPGSSPGGCTVLSQVSCPLGVSAQAATGERGHEE